MNYPVVYAVWHKDQLIRAASRSGGVFTALSDDVLEKNGVVYGCVLTNSLQAAHQRADNKEHRDRMRGSKYVQSRLGNTFKNVETDLKAGRKVLFSGTSCQVDGLRRYLETKCIVCDNLICVDIVCHGVPSPRVWKDYLSWQAERGRYNVVSADFRNKADYGWHAHKETLYLENGKKVSSQVFTLLFYGHCILRPSCYECRWKSVMHPGDITIADYWGIEKVAPEFNDDKGVSMVLINNVKGKLLFETVQGELRGKQTVLDYGDLQAPLKGPFPKPDNRKQFWMDYAQEDFEFIAKRYGKFGMKDVVRKNICKQIGRAKRLIRKLVKK